MKNIIGISSLILVLLLQGAAINVEPNQEEGGEEKQYRTLDEVKQELREERKVQEKQKMEEIKAKKLEKEQREKEKNNSTDIQEDKNEPIPNNSKKNEESIDVPKLIVRLRGSHTTKYLCSYNFIEKDGNAEKSISKENYTEYSQLLKKTSLKVRANEAINFEFSEKPNKMKVFIWGDEIQYINVKRGCIKVPDIDGKVVVGIDGQYANGSIRYAIVLDIRK